MLYIINININININIYIFYFRSEGDPRSFKTTQAIAKRAWSLQRDLNP